jgi:hypothetical protein
MTGTVRNAELVKNHSVTTSPKKGNVELLTEGLNSNFDAANASPPKSSPGKVLLTIDHADTTKTWRDDTHYNAIAGRKSLQFWAWQFLRRNPRYQSRWREFAKLCVEASNDGITHDELVVCAVNRGDFSEPWSGRTPLEVRVPLGRAWGGEFGLRYMYNPTHWDVYLPAFETRYPTVIPYGLPRSSIDGLDMDPRLGASRQYLPLVFDLSLPLEDLLKSAEKTITFWQQTYVRGGGALPVVTKLHKGKWPLYLRALDAKTHGATVSTIARMMFGDSKSGRSAARNHIRAATEFRDRDYLSLIHVK